MKSRIIYLLICCLVNVIGYGQQDNQGSNNTLRGKVLFMSSGKKPAVGVAVSGKILQKDVVAENATKVYTDNSGSYQLKFPNARNGYYVKLTIGEEDQYGQSIELVNVREVQQYQIPADASDEFEIIVCKKGARDLAAQRYYNIIKTSSDIALTETKKEMDVLLSLREKDYNKIEKLLEKITRLEKQTDSLAIYRTAFQIASINKDNASDRVLKYIQALDEGKTIQEALEFLSPEAAEEEADDAINSFEKAIEELELRAEGAEAIFDYKSAIACYEIIIRKCKKLGIDPLTIACYYQFASRIIQEDGRYYEALEYRQKVIDIRQEILDPEDTELANSYNNIGILYNRLGQYKKALKFQLKGTEIIEKILDSKHPDLAASYNNIALTYQDIGQYQNALEFQQKSLDIVEEIFDSKHPDLATSYDNIAGIYISLGQYNEALEFHQKAANIREDVLKTNHPLLATSYNNIAQTYQYLGQYEKALIYHNKSIHIQEEVLHLKHPDLAASYSNVGLNYQHLELYGKALEFQQKALEIMEEIFDSKNPSLAVTYNNVGLNYKYIGDYKKALEFQEKALRIRKQILDPNHPDLAVSYDNIGIVYGDLNQPEKALEFQQKAIHIMKNTLDGNHPDLAISYGNIGETYKKLNKYEDALRFQLKGIKIQEEILDSKHPHLVIAYSNITYTYQHLKQYQKSLEFQQKAIHVIENTIDFKHSDLAIYYHNIAATHNYLKQHEKALEYNNKAINILEETLDSKHPSLAASYNSIAATYKALNQYEKAQEYQQKSIRILKEALSENHPNQMVILNRLLEIYYNRGLDAFSRKNYASALRDFEKIITYADISEIWNYKGLCHYYSFDYPNAITAYQKAATLLPEIKQRHFYNNIGTAYVKNKQYQEAKTAFQEYEKLYPNEGRTFRNWAMYYALQNDKEKALFNLKKAIKLEYDDIEWLQTENSMDSLRKEKTFAKIIKKIKNKAKKSNDIKKQKPIKK